MTDKKKSTEKTSFEESLKRLEHLVEEMEDGELSLDKMIAHFEEGSSLVKFCEKKLTEVEQKIEQLVKEGEAIAPRPLSGSEADAENE